MWDQGGKVVIDSVEKALKLNKGQGDSCRATFQRYGNLSAASTWWAKRTRRQRTKEAIYPQREKIKKECA